MINTHNMLPRFIIRENVRKTVMVLAFLAPDSLIVAESIVCLEMSQLFESKVLYFVFDVS